MNAEWPAGQCLWELGWGSWWPQLHQSCSLYLFLPYVLLSQMEVPLRAGCTWTPGKGRQEVWGLAQGRAGTEL